MNTQTTQQGSTSPAEKKSGGDNAVSPRKKRLKIRPAASDTFTAFSFFCVFLLVFLEIVALFWLDLF